MGDVLSAAAIRSVMGTSLVGREVRYVRRCRSTNDLARKMAEAGAVDGSVLVADHQTAGRGRRGRDWFSPPGLGLWISLILRPPLPLDQISGLNLCASLSVVRALSSMTSLRLRVKWPNDVLINGRKVAGVLGELGEGRQGEQFAVVGLGLNVNHRGDDFLPSLRDKATSLRIEEGSVFSRLTVLSVLLREFEDIYEVFRRHGWSPFVPEWLRLSVLLGKRVTASFGGKIVEGRVVGLGEDGALLIEGERGVVTRMVSGHLLGEDEVADSIR